MWTGTPLFVLCSVLLSCGAQGWMTTEGWVTTGDTTSCGGYLYNSNGQFYSPNYPRNYPDNADCVWYIRIGGRQIIQLEFPFVNVEGSFDCRYDAIYVYDGSSTSNRLLGKLCGGQNSTFHSTTGYMTVRFKSDGSSNYRGFWALYRSVSGGSCTYNCGYRVGSCDCSYTCQFRGDCCHDYYNHCLANTTEPSATTEPPVSTEHVTAQRSCRYNCGSHLGSCSCSSSCQYYGNCCYDYNHYCYGVVTTPDVATPDVTTAQSSCRYNCGSHLGSCSCSSSCQYYGNCCYDYNYYCPTTTDAPVTTEHVTAQRSCRYNCGSHLGSCSCSSSCQYYGNCCYDYNYYCPTTTNAPATTRDYPSCGENLFGSGSFSSPYYPNYYHDNANCVWQLSAPSGQMISLSIIELELENCCNCDYINVYDGPSIYSRFLGKVCEGNSSLDTFNSSSNQMTVLFRSDSSVVGRGFRARFSSTLPTNKGRVDCSQDNMNIVIDRSYLNSMGYDGYNLYLNDERCRPSVYSHQVVFSFPINTCGTKREFENERVVYTNAVRAYQSRSGEISRQSHFKLHVGCRMEQDAMVQIMYETDEIINSTILGSGRFNGTMAFYTSSNFYYQVTDNPYQVKLNQNLYVQVRLRRDDSSLVLFLDTCVASPSPHDFHTRSYDLIRNGCPRDNSYHSYLSGTSSYARFTFQAFKFLRAHKSVYLQCKILICQSSDYNARCRRGCNSRKARDLASTHDTHTVVLGPIQLKDLEPQEEALPNQVKAEVEA